MRIVFYYSCPDQRLIEAKAQDNTKALAIQAAAEEFAKAFGAFPVFTQGFAPRFAGIGFDKARPPANWHLWSRPVGQNPCMTPYTAAAVPKRLKEAAENTYAKYKSLWPQEAAQEYDSALLTALGVRTAATFGNALSYFYDADKVSWIASTLPLTGASLPVTQGEVEIAPKLTGFEEVLASEFDKARAEFQRAQAEQEAKETANG